MKKVIIIGASSGIGKELAKIYLGDGCLVGITGRRKELLDEMQAQYAGKIVIENFDVRGNSNIAHLESLIQKMGGLDLLVYNAGFGDVSKQLDWELDKATYETNVKGFVEIVNYGFNYFVAKGRGQIAGTSSIAALRGNSWSPAYSASKAFMSIYMEGLQMKARKMKHSSGGGLQISITDILPGFVNTKMAKGNKTFWVTPVEKATRQIYRAIEHKKRRAYITRRWALIAWFMKWLPYSIYKRLG